MSWYTLIAEAKVITDFFVTIQEKKQLFYLRIDSVALFLCVHLNNNNIAVKWVMPCRQSNYNEFSLISVLLHITVKIMYLQS